MFSRKKFGYNNDTFVHYFSTKGKSDGVSAAANLQRVLHNGKGFGAVPTSQVLLLASQSICDN